jgi:exosome complex component RRP40
MLHADCPVLIALAGTIPFEIAVGCNGRVWVQATTPTDVVIVCNALRNAEHMRMEEHAHMVKELLRLAGR